MILKALPVLLTFTFLRSGLSFEYVDDITETTDPDIPHLLEFRRFDFSRDDSLKDKDPTDQEISFMFNSCEDQCWSNRCFCKLFAVAFFSDWAACFQYSDFRVHSRKMWGGPGLKYFKVYKWKPKCTISAVDTIVKNPKLLEMPALNEILSCYGISPEEEDFKYKQQFLKTCGLAANSENTEIDFFDWIGKDISEFKHLSQKFNSLTSASVSRLESGEQSQKRPRYSQHLPEEEFKMLKFLNIFSRQIDPELVTAYDSKHGIIFLHRGDVSILVIAFGSGNIAVMRPATEKEKKDPYNKDSPMLDLNSGKWPVPSDDEILTLFNAAIAKFSNGHKFQSIGGKVYRQGLSPTVRNLEYQSDITSWLLDYEGNTRFHDPLVFYKELQEATLQLWDKKQTVFKEHLATRQKQSQFSDTMVITQSE